MKCLAGPEPRAADGDGAGVHGAWGVPRRGHGFRVPQAGVHEHAVAAAHGRGDIHVFGSGHALVMDIERESGLDTMPINIERYSRVRFDRAVHENRRRDYYLSFDVPTRDVVVFVLPAIGR